MANQPKGRNFDEKTHSATGSSSGMGAGSTGSKSQSGQVNSQSETRTDDLLSGGVDENDRTHGFQKGKNPEDLQKGMGNTGNAPTGNKQ